MAVAWCERPEDDDFAEGEGDAETYPVERDLLDEIEREAQESAAEDQ
ncbi:MAG TPA: hypothetical protein VJT75_17800 [Thermoleophilaceae bacterium]|nr:hypothetical protein [Thermoleophilaceae bacterium]